MVNTGVNWFRFILPYAILLVLIYASRLYSYIFFHTVVETFIFLVSTGVFIIMFNARKIVNNNFIMFVSTASYFIGILNFFHMLSYEGMPFFPQYGATLASQLWIAQRFMFASSFVLATLFINKKLNAVLLYYLYMAFTGLILLAIYVWKIFPVTFVRDTGLTAFKIGSEYVIIALLGVATYLLWYNRKKFGRETYLLLFIALAISIVVEFMFTLYRSVTSLITIEAHMLLLLSYYFIYKALIEIGLTKPYSLLFLEVQKLSEKKDELLSVTSHELKNPLTSIKLYSQLLHGRMDGTKNKKANVDILAKIELQTRKINRIISDLGDVAKIETGQLVIRKTDNNTKEFLKTTVEQMRAMYPDRRVMFKAGVLPHAVFDKDRIEQVLENLITNAVKYSKGKAGVRVSAQAKRKELVFSVEDNGVGIPKDELGRIFSKYYRGDTKIHVAGIGLGLFICKQIIDMHGGKIWAKSTLGKGSSFFFSLPLKPKRSS